MYQIENTITTAEPKQKISKFALIWVAVIVLCSLFFIAAMGLLGWGVYSLVQKEEEKGKAFYATATAVAQWPVMLRDDFSKDADRWYIGEYTENGHREIRSISNGVYSWTLENALGYIYWASADAGNLEKFSLSADVRHTAGGKYDVYGLIFCNVAGNFYTFVIQDTGYYSVSVRSINKWNEIIPPSTANAIKPGEYNHLTVLGQGGNFKLFINDEFVDEFTDNTLLSGDVGLMFNPKTGPTSPNSQPNGVSRTFVNSASKIVFDNFEVRAPTGSVPETDQSPQLPSIQPERGTLVFASNRDGNRDIYTISTNGNDLKQLTFEQDDDYAPRWSPDGERIAFVSKRNGSSEIFVMDADGKNAIRLTNNPAIDIYPDWSPDGKQIIFASNRTGNYEIYLMSIDGEKTFIKQLTNTEFNETYPSISPDGTKILFQEKEKDGFRLCVMDIDGKRKKILTDIFETEEFSHGAWASDSDRVAYVMRYFGESSSEIIVGNINQPPRFESGEQITYKQGENLYPNWSPDGKQLVVVSNMNGQSDIYIMLADGDGLFRVTHNEAIEESPDWHE